ncbi:non-ribosomal peptide synthetase [Dyella sp.]|uniref:non-ribosomal peptide synthetase n=1 Tax=Dyella sp. TaxID=1869338 RepID=UPI002B46375E|nr:non-ribosomal peptide synthetase [Dyella sp.]HKT26875.1 amino acid adenylation domain-containing protein [Dyella sp.]
MLQQVHQHTLAAYAHQDVPFEQLVEALQPERHTSYTPLFQVMLVLQNTPMDTLALPGVSMQVLDQGIATAKFDLTLCLTEHPEGLQGYVEYSTDLFERRTIERMADHFTRLLQAIVTDPACAVGELDMLGDGERQQLLYGFNDTAKAYPNVSMGAHTLQQLFEAQVARTPDRVAVIYEDMSLSYAELNAQANGVARHLRTLGVGPDGLVGVCMERSLDMIVALYGILKAGGAYVPLEPGYPADRLAAIVEDARLSVVLTQQRLRERVPHVQGVRVISLDSEAATLARHATDNLDHDVQPNHLAYVIYTSGSTGKPKGVGIDHQGIVNRLQWMQDAYPLTAADRVLQKTPFSFDVSVWEFFWPLLEGAMLVVARPGGHQDVAYLAALIDAQSITTLHFVPPMLDVFINEAGECGRSMRQVMCSGQALPLELQQRFFARWPHVALHNLYGPTEASVDVTAWECRKDSALACVPIGRPIANIQIHILDDALNPVPVGVVGHLYIAGVGLARGYIHRPALTAQSFVPNPFSAAPGARMYRSGDLARYLPDGSIEYLGRSDHQVKIRGLRIELGDIEASLAALESVRDVIVLARTDARNITHLVAYLVAHAAQTLPDEAQLRALLSKKLPDYMVPSHFVTLDAMPLTPNGKVDRKALPAPDLTQSAKAYVAPRTPDEQRMAAIWADVLKLDRVGIHDDFFELGGHSLLATQLVSRIAAVFQVRVSLHEIFDAPTLVEMVGCVRPASAQNEISPQAPTPAGETFPLSFAQQRLWLLDQFEGRNAAYNMPVTLRLKGELHRDALQRALDDVVQRHDVLRACFESVEDAPVQRILPRMAWPLVYHDLSDLAQSAREAMAKTLIVDETRIPFDLASPPLVRGALVRCDAQEHLLLLTMHHIVSDGWSMGILMREVAAFYAHHARGLPLTLPPLPMRYVDFASWQRQWLSGEVLAQQLDYWKRQLAGSPALLALPTDRPRPSVQGRDGASLLLAVPAELSGKLKALSRKSHGSLFMTLCAAFNVLLARYAGQTDICIGTPIANRNQGDIEGLIGFFVNTLVLRTQVDLTQNFDTLLQQVRQHTLDAYAHQDVPFEQLVDVLQPERHASYTPLFQVMLVLQNAPMGELALPGLSMQLLDHESTTSKFDLTLSLMEGSDGLKGHLEYSTDLFDRHTMQRMADHFTRLLQAIVADPHCAVGKLPMLSEAERDHQLRTLNNTATAYPAQPQTLHQCFEAQAARTPHALAVMQGDASLSYAQLNARANRLAHHLRHLGVGPGALVGLCMERGVDMMVALHGILKAGGAYVPLDPAYPPERLAMILDDAGPAAILTQQHVRARLPALPGVPVLCLDGEADLLHGYAQDNPPNHTQPEHTAYVIYTSGSTGKPKGVMVPHRSLLHYVWHCVREYLREDIAGAVVSSPLGFDATVTTLLPPLLVGKPIVLLPDDERTLPQLSARLFAPGAAWLFKITPAHLEALSYLGEAAAVDETGVPGEAAHCIVVGGEQLTLSTLRRWKGKLLPAASFVNEYGPTETTVGCCIWQLSDAAVLDTLEGTAAPIGRAIGNTQLYVLGECMQLQPLGSVGELYIGGEGVALGYLRRAELTEQRFVDDPFGQPGARLYRTGDLVRYRADGELEFLGRCDDQVKLRGFRIELGEIEQQLSELPDVQAAAVMLREDAPGEKRLVAYVVPAQEREQDDAAIAAACRTGLSQRLPEYMVPNAFVVLKTLPLTVNGKVDRKALPAPDPMQTQSDAAYVAPRTPVEQTMVEIWADVLGLGKVGVFDDFFELGGQSLLATQMMSRIKRALHVELPLRAVFEASTVAALAAKVEHADISATPSAPATHRVSSNLVPIRKEGDLTPLFLIHPIGGEVQYAVDLARHLDANQPVYALAASGVAAGETPHGSIREMAACYLKQIRQLQANGPYKLAGWSLGGMVAYDMAHQLRGDGESVRFVGMVDTGSSRSLRAQRRAEHAFEARIFELDACSALLHWVIDLHPDIGDARQHAAYDELMALMERKDVDTMIAICQRESLLPQHLDMALVRRMLAVYEAGANAAEAYEAPAVDMPVTYFAAERDEGEDLTSGWQDLLGQRLDVVRIGGSHHSIVKPPHLEKLAREISRRIRSHSPSGELSLA